MLKDRGKIGTMQRELQWEKVLLTYISFSHLIVGAGSPTALHGNTMSLIHGVVTVLLKVKIRAGAATHTCSCVTHAAKVSPQTPEPA